MAKNCILVTPEIEALAKQFNNETLDSVANLVGIWQERNNSLAIPSFQEVNGLKKALRKEDIARVESILSVGEINDRKYQPSILSEIYSSSTRKQRVILISEMFSAQVDKEMKNNPNLSRQEIIQDITPDKIFDSIKNYFNVLSNPEKIRSEFGDDSEHVANEYKKIVDNFDHFIPEVTQVLAITENFLLNQSEDYDPNILILDDDISGESFTEDAEEAYTKEETYKDHWMEDVRFINPVTSLSREVRNLLRQIPQINKNGEYVLDDIGNPEYVNANQAHAILIKELSNMTSIEDLIPMLEELSKKHAWVNEIIFLLEDPNNERLLSKFYMDFRKDFQEMWIQTKTELPNGKLRFKTVSLNRANDASAVLNEWQTDVESGIVFDNYSVYNNRGEVVKANAIAGLELVNSLKQEIHNKGSQVKLEMLEDNTFFEKIVSALNRVGINENPGVIKDALKNITIIEGITKPDPIDNVLRELTTIYQGLAKKQVPSTTIIDEYKRPYSNIANILNAAQEDDLVSAVRESGKARYSHIVPSYFGKLIKNLKGVRGVDKFNEFINNEFKKYDWFYKDGIWYNTWIEELVNNQEVRDKLSYHTLLNINVTKGKKEYADWSQLDYMVAMLNEYFIDGVNTTAKNPYAYYHIPIMADSQAAEFIHFKRYTNYTGGRTITGDNVSYQDQILDKMEKTVIQEFNRIAFVRQRQEAREDPNNNIKPIKNFDDKGDEFKFLPELNSLKDNYFLNNNRLFINNLQDLIDNDDPRLRDFIRESLRVVVENGFSEAYSHWNNIGLLDKTKDGSNVYLEVNGDPTEMLREYYWNSQFATSQIIQITTTDLAFYGGLDDFQKRYKEIEAKANKLNILSIYGKPYERTVYLADEKIMSNSISDIKDVLDRRVERGLLSKLGRDAILSKFNQVNATDAQAFRTLESYRSVMDMAGRWTPEQNTAMENFINGTWSINDFNVLFQPIKPFVYTQTNVRSGIVGSSDIKVPVQHKNSEYLLMAAHSIVANETGKSPKLVALNKWMIDNNIDVVQFESAVKVGLQGVVDLSGINTYDGVYGALNKAIKTNGSENSDVVHRISYEDYGIQVELPEHTLDTEILFGTQLRALIIADLPNNTIFDIDGKSMTKDEVVRLYNELLVNNIVNTATEVSNIFSDPIRLNAAVLEELKGNPRYSADLMNAVRLQPNGKPLIPYYGAINNLRVQSLLNSIQKRVVRQKIKGGSYIQVSNFGLTDDLRIVFEGDGNNKRVKHWEAYLPYWSKKYFPDNFLNGETHELDVTKIPEDLRRVIGYRIPTENKYSMIPIYIKGFLPQQSGDSIMLPADITTVVGSDFDVDHLYLMFPEFNEDGNKTNYNYNENPDNQSIKARNNALIDIMWGILTNPQIAEQSFIPGNYDLQKQTASIITIAQSGTTKTLKELSRLRLKDVVDLSISVRDKMNPLSPVTQTLLHECNMTGAKMIGIIANNKKHHALMQFTDLSVSGENSFILNGKKLTALNSILNQNNTGYISEPLSGFLAASVDNGKDPVLGFMNINSFTINSAMLLSRLGYTPLEVGLFLSQPAIVDLSRRYNNGERNVVDNYVREQIPTSSFSSIREANRAVENTSFDNGTMFNNIVAGQNSSTTNVMNALLFDKINKVANDLAKLTRIRVDNGNGSIGPHISNTIINQKRLHDLLYDIKNTNSFTLRGADYIIEGIENSHISDVKQELMESQIPYIQASYTGGVASSKKNMQEYFYQYSQTMLRAYDQALDDSAVSEFDPVLLNKFFEEYIAFKSTGFEFFGYDEKFTTKEKRRDMIENFPKFFNDVVSSNADVAELPFIKKLKLIKKNDVPFKTIEFINANHLTQNQRDDYSNQWAYLVYHKNEQVRRLGVGLVLYSVYKGGFGFGPSSFISLAPTAVQVATPQFIEANESVMNNDNYSISDFVDQFFRNHLYEKKLVTPLDPETDINVGEEITLTSSELRDKYPELVKEIHNDFIVPKSYFSIYRNGVSNYYKLSLNLGFDNQFTYNKITPLGIKNILLEYEYGFSGNDVLSIIPQRKKDINVEDPVNDENNDYEESLDINEDVRVIKDPQLYSDSINDYVLNSVFGTSNVPGENNAPNKKKSILEYEPNINFRDKDGLKMC